jgi:tRNA-Thr(GGU) m(6)t(6)A37 methyltransferase TsaA
MSTPFETALLNLKLFELRREPVLREARDWFVREFNPESFDDVLAAVRSERNAAFRMVIGYWDTAASLVTTGAVDRDAFLAAHGEVFLAFSKIHPFLAQMRAATGEPDLCRHIESVVMGVPDAEAILSRRRQAAIAAAKPRAHPGGLVSLQPIGFVRSGYTETTEIPKGPDAQHTAEGFLEIRPELEAGLADIDGFSHLYVIWIFDRAGEPELEARPPSDDRPHGVFATRSPRRPNPIGLTVVRLLGREGARLRVKGIDMLDGTPIIDIKPYLSSVPAEQLQRGWLEEAEQRRRGM